MIKKNKIIALVIVFTIVFSFSGCLKYSSNILNVDGGANMGANGDGFDINNLIPADPNPGAQGGINQGGINQGGINQGGTNQGGTNQGGTNQGGTNQGGTNQGGTNQGDVNQGGTNQGDTNQGGATAVDPSTWTSAEVLAYVTNAVTKTKAYTNQITVNHQEAFDVRVTKAPGGKLVMDVADRVIASVAKPTQSTLTFNGGKTTNGEGEVVPLLLPKRGAFTLTADGVASATARMNGDSVVCQIKLVEEVGTLTDHPVHHAASVGYLDASDVDLTGIKLNYLDITYTGTTIDIVINSDGYVSAAVYTIPIHIAVEASIGFTVAGECEGKQQESWQINW